MAANKKKPGKKKAPKQPVEISKRDKDLDALIAQFWTAFGMGSGMLISMDCSEAAAELGYYSNVSKRKVALMDDKNYRERTLGCCWKAGKKAAENAKGEGRSEINADDFRFGSGQVHATLEKLSKRAAKKDQIIMAGIC